jgi:DNA-binding LacI/PurR family transcriptional regulator
LAITIREVAQRAGVSVGTVSHVLNGKPGEYSQATRDKVMEAVGALDYHPNRIARSLVRRRSMALGVSFVNHGASLADNPYLADVLDGMINAASEDGYNITLYTRLPPDDEEQHLPLLLDRHVDGLCLVAPNVDSCLPRLLQRSRIPFVVVGVAEPGKGISWLDVDNEAGTRLAVECLARYGHRKIAHFMGPASQKAAIQRAQAFRAAMRDLGLPVREDWLIPCGFDTVRAHHEALRLLAQKDRPTAVFAAHDETAFGVVAAARELGVSVPRELSVIGFDDIREAAHIDPPLTTVRQPATEIGYAAAKALVGLLDGQSGPPVKQLFAPVLVERGTVQVPAA